MKKNPSHKLFYFVLSLLLILFSIPWYWPDNLIRPFILGLPLWAFASFVFSFLFACCVSWIILRHWDSDD